MEVRLEVGEPRLEAVAHEAMLAEEEDCSALPRAPAQQLAVVPEVACSLAQHVGREVPGHQAHQPAPPQLAAAHRAVEVERHAAVLRFLARVPVPQRLQPRLRALHRLRMLEHVLREDRGEMFGGGGDRDGRTRVGHGLEQLQPLDDAPFPGVRVALLSKLRIEQRMNAPVRRFLPDEALDLGLESRALLVRQGFDARAHRVDEELLADREAHRQRVEISRAERVAAVPVASERHFEIDQQAANHQRSHCVSPVS